MILYVYDMLIGVDNLKKNRLETKKQTSVLWPSFRHIKNSGHKMLKIKGFVSSVQNMATPWGDAIRQRMWELFSFKTVVLSDSPFRVSTYKCSS